MQILRRAGRCFLIPIVLGTTCVSAVTAEIVLARHERERAQLASARIRRALGRTVVAHMRIENDLASVKGVAPEPHLELASPIGLESSVRTKRDLAALVQSAQEMLKQCEQGHNRLEESAKPFLPKTPEPFGVPLWSIEARDRPALQDEAKTTAELLAALDTIVFSAEQLTQAAEVIMEQIIGMADLERRKNLSAEVDGDWKELGPTVILSGEGYDGTRVPVSGRVTSLTVAPSCGMVFAGTALGGVWRSSISRAEWKPLSDQEGSLSIGALAFDPAGGVLYAGTGEGNIALRKLVVQSDRVLPGSEGIGLLRSSDCGSTWILVGRRTFDGAAFLEIAALPEIPGFVIAATTAGLFTSRDAGESWYRMTNGVPLQGTGAIAVSVWVDPENAHTAFAAFWGEGVFRTDTLLSGDPSWVRVFGGLPASNMGRIRIRGALGGATLYVLVSTADHRLRGLYFSTDGGNQWERIEEAPDLLQGQGFYHMLLGVSPQDAQTVFIGGAGRRRMHPSSLYRGHNTGGRWSFTPIGSELHVDFHSVAFEPAGLGSIFVSNDGGVWHSQDSGDNWASWNTNLAITQVISIDQHPDEPGHIIAGTQDNGTIAYVGSPAWIHVDDGDGGVVRFDPKRPSRVFSEYVSFRLTRSDHGGRPGTFRPIHPVLSNADSAFPAPYDLNPDNPEEILLGTTDVHITQDGGRTWHALEYRLTLGRNEQRASVITTIRYSDGQTAYVGTSDGRVWRLMRPGLTGDWTADLLLDTPTLLGRRLYVADISSLPLGTPHSPGEMLYVGFSEGSQTLWTCFPNTSASQRCAPTGKNQGVRHPVYSIAVASAHSIFLGSNDGVYVFDPKTGESVKFGRGLPRTAVLCVRLHPQFGLLRAGTFGRGVWEIKLVAGSGR